METPLTIEQIVASNLPTTDFEKPWAPRGMKRGDILRRNDETGVSGTGIVCQVCLFADGMAAVQWLCPPAAGDVVVKKWDAWLEVHVRAHPKNRTVIIWEDGTHEVFEPIPKPKEEPDGS